MIVSLGPELLARLTRLDNASPTAETEQLDGDLVTAVRRTERMRKLFYAAVLAVALYGSATRAPPPLAPPRPWAGGGGAPAGVCSPSNWAPRHPGPTPTCAAGWASPPARPGSSVPA